MYFNIIVIKFVENFKFSNLSKILSNDIVCPVPLIDPDKSWICGKNHPLHTPTMAAML
jgi:hypothetical protein